MCTPTAIAIASAVATVATSAYSATQQHEAKIAAQQQAQQQATAAQQAQDTRQQQIDSATTAINNAYNDPNRTAQYQALHDSVFNTETNQLNQQYQNAARNLKFNLARRGQMGGSVATDKNALLNQNFQNGTMQVSQDAQTAADNLRAADQTAKNNLTQQVQQGINLNNAGTLATQGMATSLANANATAGSQALGSQFANMAYAQQGNAFNQGYAAGYGASGMPMGSYMASVGMPNAALMFQPGASSANTGYSGSVTGG